MQNRSAIKNQQLYVLTDNNDVMSRIENPIFWKKSIFDIFSGNLDFTNVL